MLHRLFSITLLVSSPWIVNRPVTCGERRLRSLVGFGKLHHLQMGTWELRKRRCSYGNCMGKIQCNMGGSTGENMFDCQELLHCLPLPLLVGSILGGGIVHPGSKKNTPEIAMAFPVLTRHANYAGILSPTMGKQPL